MALLPTLVPVSSREESAGMTVTATRSDSMHRDRDRNRDVAEQLPDLQLHHQDRNEHHDRGERRHQHRAPDLARPLIGRLAADMPDWRSR